MSINVDEYLQALDAPSIILEGETYTGKHISVRKAAQLIRSLESADLESEEGIERTKALLDELGLPGEKLVDLPIAVFNKVLADFFTAMQDTNTK